MIIHDQKTFILSVILTFRMLNSPNAVYCQIWIAISIYLLIAIAKKKLDLAISLYTFAQTMGLTLFVNTPIKELFTNNNFINLSDENQLSLWNS
jgi:energy-coupling factor transporter transmembrane protein EcfT